VDFEPGMLQTAKPCEVHTKHVPTTHVQARHHIWPKSEGGPTVEDNLVIVCATGHYNIHQLLRIFIANNGKVPYGTLKPYSRQERALAKLGWQRLTRKAM
jgi:hypothetical protein